MKHIIEATGNLTFLIENDRDREILEDIKDRVGGNDVRFLDDMLDQLGFLGNAKLFGIAPVDIGALTDAPMLSDAIDLQDDGSIVVLGNVWWYPNYQVEDFAERLIKRGSVTFQAAA
ncbi:hypothetical protein [Burkholderia cepacia]|uniref:hypothetical protein n=1 Tax=Burkholderia cepacia TaxID=292 RepID=UPI0026DF1833|nr:hypothetical protein [Burkholderia cepacia]MDO5947978.1 hypothetical protein [Burkholderia cepacia]